MIACGLTAARAAATAWGAAGDAAAGADEAAAGADEAAVVDAAVAEPTAVDMAEGGSVTRPERGAETPGAEGEQTMALERAYMSDARSNAAICS